MSQYCAYEIFGDIDVEGPFLFTCEHASNVLPPGFEETASDRKLLDDHWGWDIGARDLLLGLQEILGGQGISSNFSRLIVDPNRPPDADSLIVSRIDGQDISFNQNLDDAERERRKRTFFEPYHQAVDRTGRERAKRDRPFHLLSLHSFTPLYLGRERPMEVGVLFDDFDEDAWRLESALAEQGFESALNAPYSGRGPGALIYSANRHGRSLGVKYLELEVRQDLIETPAKAHAVAQRLARALEVFLP